jgi:tetratricopeptide (TPR) repeat protein
VTLGLVLEKQGKQADAKAQYVAAIELDPKLVSANQALLALLDRDAAPDAGLSQRRKWLIADPTSNDARWSLIQQLIRLKNDDEALSEIAKLTLRAGDSMRSTYRFAAAGLYEQRERWADAVKDLQSIWSTEPSDSLAQRLAYAFERNGQVPDAERLLKTQLTKAKEKGQLTLALAGFYERNKRFGEASTIYEDIITADPGIKVAFDGLARTRKAAGEPGKLVEFVKTLILGPSTAPPPALLVSTERALLEQSQSAEWTVLIAAAAEKFKLDIGIQKTYARNLTRPGSTPEQKRQALAALMAASTTAPQDDDLWFQLGRLQQELGDKPAAIKSYREAVKRKPNGPARSALIALGEKVD